MPCTIVCVSEEREDWFLVCCDSSSWWVWWEGLFDRHHRSHSQQDLIRDNKDQVIKHGQSKIFLDSVSQHINRISGAIILIQSPRPWTHRKLLVRNGKHNSANLRRIWIHSPLQLWTHPSPCWHWTTYNWTVIFYFQSYKTSRRACVFQDVWLWPDQWDGQGAQSGLQSLHPGHGLGHCRGPWGRGEGVGVKLSSTPIVDLCSECLNKDYLTTTTTSS